MYTGYFLNRYGESQKLASAVFTLARKIAPCIIFVDEIDSLLRSRDTHDHEATAMIKAQFMQMWDGLETSSESVVVMGATNRPRGKKLSKHDKLQFTLESTFMF